MACLRPLLWDTLGFEPTRHEVNRFTVGRASHCATLSHTASSTKGKQVPNYLRKAPVTGCPDTNEQRMLLKPATTRKMVSLLEN